MHTIPNKDINTRVSRHLLEEVTLHVETRKNPYPIKIKKLPRRCTLLNSLLMFALATYKVIPAKKCVARTKKCPTVLDSNPKEPRAYGQGPRKRAGRWLQISSWNCPSLPLSHGCPPCPRAVLHLLPPCIELGLSQQPGLWFGVHVWKQDLKRQLAQLASHCPHIVSCIHCYWEAYKRRELNRKRTKEAEKTFDFQIPGSRKITIKKKLLSLTNMHSM